MRFIVYTQDDSMPESEKANFKSLLSDPRDKMIFVFDFSADRIRVQAIEDWWDKVQPTTWTRTAPSTSSYATSEGYSSPGFSWGDTHSDSES